MSIRVELTIKGSMDNIKEFINDHYINSNWEIPDIGDYNCPSTKTHIYCVSFQAGHLRFNNG